MQALVQDMLAAEPFLLRLNVPGRAAGPAATVGVMPGMQLVDWHVGLFA